MSKKVNAVESVVVESSVSPIAGLFVEKANREFIKVGDEVTVCDVHINKEGAKNPFTVTFQCKKTGKNGGVYFTFHKHSTNKEYKKDSKFLVVSIGDQHISNERIKTKKNDAGELEIVKEACDITVKATGEHFTEKAFMACDKWVSNIGLVKF